MRLEGFDKVKKRLAEVRGALEIEMREAVSKAGMVVEREAKKNCPVDTGHLRRSIHTVVDLFGPPRAEVGTDIHYASYVEFGWRGPAKRSSWFAPIGSTQAGKRWLTQAGFGGAAGIIVSGDPARHPPQPYLLPALESSRDRINALFKAAVQKAARR